jgi:transcriptional regulator with XRE-family HTH domain
MDIGKYIKRKRESSGIGLRKFAQQISVDASNWSKIERGVLPFRMDKKKTAIIAKVLGLKKGSKEMEDFYDSIAISQNRLPDDIVKESAVSYNLKEKFVEIRNEIRISVPHLMTEKFKNMLLYVLEKCAGKPNVGETVLYKLLYFIDFNYYEVYEEQLSGASYRKLEYGPVPHKIDKILGEMEEKGEIQTLKTKYFNFEQKRFIPLLKPDLTKLKASEKDIIDKTLGQLADMNAKGIADYSYNDIPWKATKEKETIDYELVFYRTAPYSQRVYKEDEDGIQGD